MAGVFSTLEYTVHNVSTSLMLSGSTHWGRLTYVCVNKLTIIGSDNGLSPGRPQAIIWTNAGILLTERLGKHFSEFCIEIHIQIHIHIQEIPFENVVWKMV